MIYLNDVQSSMIYPLKLVIFHSYGSLPEGNYISCVDIFPFPFRCWNHHWVPTKVLRFGETILKPYSIILNLDKTKPY